MSSIPDYAHRVIVPLANPKTARELLNLAASLVHPEDGKIIALTISLGETETEAQSIHQLEPIVEECQEHGDPVELISVTATGVARGILDTVREYRGDLLILGVHKPMHGQVVIGTVAENVATTAPCDVLLYRSSQSPNFSRTLVWASGGSLAKIACQVGALIAEKAESKVEAIFVQGSGRSYWQGRARVEQSLEGVIGAEKFKRTVVTANDLGPGLLSRINEDDLLILSFSRRTALEKWLMGDFVRTILDRAEGPVVLVSRAVNDQPAKKQLRRSFQWITPTLTRVEKEDTIRQAREQSHANLDYMMLIMISAIIATLGLLLNSAAVIIGAMLVAPLMQPLVALSTGITVANFSISRRSVITVSLGVMFALVISIVTGLLVPTKVPTAEMLSRGSPSLLDAGVALASGMIGAYASARRGIPSALAGVAIAAALMPPLCTVGLAIAFQETDLAAGSMLLFIMNITYISFSGSVVFFWLGLHPGVSGMPNNDERQEQQPQWRRYLPMLFMILLVIPLAIILRTLGMQASDEQIIQDRLDEFLQPAELIEVELSGNDPLRVVATVRATRTPSRTTLQSAEDDLREVLDEDVELQIILMRILEP